jgi:hypothetical protein
MPLTGHNHFAFEAHACMISRQGEASKMDVAVILAVAILTYAILIYNRMQRLWQTVREGLANVDMEVGVLADLTKRVTMRPGDVPCKRHLDPT